MKKSRLLVLAFAFILSIFALVGCKRVSDADLKFMLNTIKLPDGVKDTNDKTKGKTNVDFDLSVEAKRNGHEMTVKYESSDTNIIKIGEEYKTQDGAKLVQIFVDGTNDEKVVTLTGNCYIGKKAVGKLTFTITVPTFDKGTDIKSNALYNTYDANELINAGKPVTLRGLVVTNVALDQLETIDPATGLIVPLYLKPVSAAKYQVGNVVDAIGCFVSNYFDRYQIAVANNNVLGKARVVKQVSDYKITPEVKETIAEVVYPLANASSTPRLFSELKHDCNTVKYLEVTGELIYKGKAKDKYKLFIKDLHTEDELLVRYVFSSYQTLLELYPEQERKTADKKGAEQDLKGKYLKAIVALTDLREKDYRVSVQSFQLLEAKPEVKTEKYEKLTSLKDQFKAGELYGASGKIEYKLDGWTFDLATLNDANKDLVIIEGATVKLNEAKQNEIKGAYCPVQLKVTAKNGDTKFEFTTIINVYAKASEVDFVGDFDINKANTPIIITFKVVEADKYGGYIMGNDMERAYYVLNPSKDQKFEKGKVYKLSVIRNAFNQLEVINFADAIDGVTITPKAEKTFEVPNDKNLLKKLDTLGAKGKAFEAKLVEVVLSKGKFSRIKVEYGNAVITITFAKSSDYKALFTVKDGKNDKVNAAVLNKTLELKEGFRFTHYNGELQLIFIQKDLITVK